MQETQNKELIITPPESPLLAIAEDSIIILANKIEARFEAMNRIKKIALKLTNRHDWIDENGKPYLQASGAEKVARLFGISWRISEPTLENLDGGHFSFTYKGEFSLSGASIEAIGTRSSKDGFFKRYRYEGSGDNKKQIELPVSEIDRGDVKKAAYTNLLGNGITRLLGIRNLTYEDLKEFAGIGKDQITSVQYRKGGSPAKVPAPIRAAAPIGEPALPAMTSQPTAPGAPTGKVVQNLAEFKRLLMSHKIATNEVYEILSIKSFMELVGLDDAWAKIKQAKNIQ